MGENSEIHWCYILHNFKHNEQAAFSQPPFDQRLSWSSDLMKQSHALLSLMKNRAHSTQWMNDVQIQVVKQVYTTHVSANKMTFAEMKVVER